MNLLIKIFIFLSVCSVILSAQNCRAKIIIETNKESAFLFIDENYIAQGKIIRTELENGRYIIQLIEDPKRWNAEIIKDTLEIVDCNDTSLTYNFENKILIDSNPQDVYVIKGDSLLGFTPLLIDNNFDELKLSKPGFINKTISLSEIKSGQKPELTFSGELKKENFYNTMLFKILAGTAIALGATTAYYKLEADRKFDEYQVTGDPELLNQTDRFDIISGVTFVALQINVGLIIYFFLSD